MANNRFGISKNVFVLGLVSFFNDIASEMIYPIVPIFLTSVLGAPMAIVGLIEGIAESTASILKAFSGWLSDKAGKRKPFTVMGYSLSTFAKPLLFFANAWYVVLAARFVDRVGKGLRAPARDALIADSSLEGTIGSSFGFHRAMDTAGATVGPLLALLLIYIFNNNFRPIFLITIIPSAIGVLLLLFLVKEKKRNIAIHAEPVKLNIKQFSPRFKMFLLISLVFAVGNSSDAFLILRAKDLGFTTFSVVLAYVVYNFFYSFLSLPFGHLSDKIGRKRVITAGFLVFALVYFGFALSNSSVSCWFLFAIYGFYMALTEGVGKAYICDLTPADKRGTALGVYYTLTGIVAFFASLVAGLLWNYVDARAPFVYGGVTAILACLMFITLKPSSATRAP